MGEIIKIVQWVCVECGKSHESEPEAKECCN